MKRDPQLKTVTGESIRVGDSHLRAAIGYIDSPNDYSEFLRSAVLSQTMGDLVLLDDEPVIHLWKQWDKLRAQLRLGLQIASRFLRRDSSR